MAKTDFQLSARGSARIPFFSLDPAAALSGREAGRLF